MGQRRVPYASVAALLRRELVRGEGPETAALMARLRPVKRRGRFTRAEFLSMCRWKSPRAIRHCEAKLGGWEPKINLEEGLKKTIHYFKNLDLTPYRVPTPHQYQMT